MVRTHAPAWAILAVVGLGACRQKEEPPAPKPRRLELFTGPWGWVSFHEVELALPKEFSEKMDHGTDQRLFFGPDVGGFRSSVQVIRRPFQGELANWAERYVDKFRVDPQIGAPLVEEGPSRIAGLPAYRVVHRARGAGRDFVNVTWLWVANGRGYYLRGLAERSSYIGGYDAFFERVRSTVRLAP